MARQRLSEMDFRTRGKDKDDAKRTVKRGGVALPFIGYLDGMSKEQSLYALLFCAAAVDGKIHPDEIAEVNALAVRTTTLGKVSAKKLQKLQEAIEESLDDSTEVLRLAEKASRVFRGKPNRAASAFMHTLDIMFADRELTGQEKKFIKQMAHFLGVSPDKAQHYVDVIMTKNDH